MILNEPIFHDILVNNDMSLRFLELKHSIDRFSEFKKKHLPALREHVDEHTVLLISKFDVDPEIRTLFHNVIFKSRELLDDIIRILNHATKDTKNQITRKSAAFMQKLINGDYDSHNQNIIKFLKSNFSYIYHIRAIRNSYKATSSSFNFRFKTDHFEVSTNICVNEKDEPLLRKHLKIESVDDAIKNKSYHIILYLDKWIPELKEFFETSFSILQDGDLLKNKPDILRQVRQALASSIENHNDWHWWVLCAQTASSPEQKEIIYRKGIVSLPNNPELLGNLASFLWENDGDCDEVEQLLKHAISLAPKNTTNLCLIARFMWRCRNNKEEANRYFQRLLAISPPIATHLADYANYLYLAQKDYKNAKKHYEMALKIDPENIYIIRNYAQLMMNKFNDNTQAECLLRQIFEMGQENANDLGNLAIALFRANKNHDEAESLFRKAEKINPENPNMLNSFACFLWSIRDDIKEARKRFEHAYDLCDSDTYHISNYANFLWQVDKNYQKAESLFERAIKIDPKNFALFTNYAAFMWRAHKNFPKAEELYKYSLDINPHDEHTINCFKEFLKDKRKIFPESDSQ